MKLKKILKKVLKYVVTPFALVCSIIGLYSINSYAYITDTYSHTLTYLSDTSDSSYNIIYYQVNNPINSYYRDFYFLVNFSTNINQNVSSRVKVDVVDSNYTVIRNFSEYFLSLRNYNGVLTGVFSNESYSVSESISYLKFSFPLSYLSVNEVTNVDFILKDKLTTTYYLDTYVSSYQQQLAQLQQDYDTLESNYDTLQDNYDTLESNYDTLEDNYNTLENEYEQKQNEYDMLTNGQLGYLDYIEFYINNQSIQFGNDSETELNLNELVNYNLYSNNSLNLTYFTTQQVNPNYLPLKIVSYYDELPVNLFSMYFNGTTSGIIKIGYYYNSEYILKQISFDNTGTSVDASNTSLINYEIFNGISVEYIEYIEIQFNNADLISSSINFNSTYNVAYSTGYTNGYNYGYNVSDNINSEKIEAARQEGYQNGYDTGNIEGYNRGYNEGSTQDMSTNGFKTLITTILSYPVNMVRESLNFEFMGIHVASIVLFIVSLGIVAFVIKRFKD